MTLATSCAACRGENSSCASASLTRMPTTASATSRAFLGVLRTYFAFAITSISLLEGARALRVVAMAAKAPRGRELAQFVADHVLADVDGHVLLPVVDRDRMADHVRVDRRIACPGADDPLLTKLVHLRDLLLQVLVDERTLLGASAHSSISFPCVE